MFFSVLFVDCSETGGGNCLNLTVIVSISSPQEHSLDNSFAVLCPSVQAMAASGMATEQFSGFKF